MIRYNDGVFTICTDNTTYAFQIMETGHLEHLYYGERINMEKDGALALSSRHECPGGNLISYSDEYKNITFENIPLEVSSYGKGDVREPSVIVEHADGSSTSDFIYESHEIINGHTELEGLPSAYVADAGVQQLTVKLKDKCHDTELYIVYTAFEKCDCITRSTRIVNVNEDSIRVRRLMSCHVDFRDSGYDFINFSGGWTREMDMNVTPCLNGKIVNSSMTGTSSSRNNPFVMAAATGAGENHGDCYGFNLIYSGNHYECAEVGSYNTLRLVTGINPEGFSYDVKPMESFQAPEAVMTYSAAGLNSLSHNMHAFLRNHIVRGEWQHKERPVLLNSWEACYFKFDEKKLVRLAKKAAEAGIELFVLDDGWFGKRDNDDVSLGDWECNMKKLPTGLAGLAKKINALGMDFGLWVEPEMVNEDSDCYNAHPEWAVGHEKIGEHSKGRNQLILNLTLEPVREYIIESMSKVFSSANITYVKWDMNRIFSDVYGSNLANQQEFSHRYVLGLYHVLDELTRRFPHILFEGCAAGGNRFDLGMLCYMPQIWASDNTDAWCRTKIQMGYSYGYPMSVMGAHVSACPNHQTLRNTPLETRFNVAAYGCLGYELNMAELPREELEQVKEQIAFYKKHRSTFFNGQFYRVKNEIGNGVAGGGRMSRRNYAGIGNDSSTEYQWIVVSEDKTAAIGMQIHDKAVPNMSQSRFIAMGLDNEMQYHFYNRKLKYNIKEFGDLINSVAPFHIKKDSIIHNAVARFMKLDGETEDYYVSGSLLNKAGIVLKENYSAIGYNSEVRYYQDYSSRVFVMEEVEL